MQGNVNNVDGVVAVGGSGILGELQISGNYNQGSDAVVVVTALNNGIGTMSDQLVINGAAQLNGGTLLVGYLDSSLGLVTNDFSPIAFRGGVSGQFSPVIDAGGITLSTEFVENVAATIVTILGAKPVVPENLISDQTRFLDSQQELQEVVASNASAARSAIDELSDEVEQGSLVCN